MTSAYLACQSPMVHSTRANLNALPASIPQQLLDMGGMPHILQAATTGGNLPLTITPTAVTSWTGGMPAFWLSST